MRCLNGYPRWFYPVVMATLLALLLSGVLLLPSFFFNRIQWDFIWQIHPSWRVISASMHLLFGFIVLMIVGALSAIHMRIGLRRKRQIFSGIILLVAFAITAISAIVIYYAGDEQWSISASIVHVSVGLLLAMIFIWHHQHSEHKKH